MSPFSAAKRGVRQHDRTQQPGQRLGTVPVRKTRIPRKSFGESSAQSHTHPRRRSPGNLPVRRLRPVASGTSTIIHAPVRVSGAGQARGLTGAERRLNSQLPGGLPASQIRSTGSNSNFASSRKRDRRNPDRAHRWPPNTYRYSGTSSAGRTDPSVSLV